jgi:hypothetical protein
VSGVWLVCKSPSDLNPHGWPPLPRGRGDLGACLGTVHSPSCLPLEVLQIIYTINSTKNDLATLRNFSERHQRGETRGS